MVTRGTLEPVLHPTSSSLKVLLLYGSPSTSIVLVPPHVKTELKTVSFPEGFVVRVKVKVNYLEQYIINVYMIICTGGAQEALAWV